MRLHYGSIELGFLEARIISLTSIVWLIALGKFLIVQDGVSFSGGSCDEA